MSEVGSEFELQFVSVRQGFDALVRSGSPDMAVPAPQVIDSDLTTFYDAQPFDDLAGVRRVYEGLVENLPADAQHSDSLALEVRADLMFVRVLMGETVEFEEYSEATTGVKPQMVPAERLAELQGDLNAVLGERGMSHDLDSIEQYEAMLLRDPADIRMRSMAAMAGGNVLANTFVPASTEKVSVNFVDEPQVPWIAGCQTDADRQVVLDINIAPNKRYTRASPAEVALHEHAGHARHLANWKAEIAAGRLSPAFGLTAMHAPIVVQAEAIAQTLERFAGKVLPDDEQWEARLQDVYQRFRFAVLHNALVAVNSGDSPAAVAKRTIEQLPFEIAESVESRITDVHEDPMLRAAYAAYQPALEVMEPVFGMKPKQQREVLGALYSRPFTPAQIGELVAAPQPKEQPV